MGVRRGALAPHDLVTRPGSRDVHHPRARGMALPATLAYRQTEWGHTSHAHQLPPPSIASRCVPSEQAAPAPAKMSWRRLPTALPNIALKLYPLSKAQQTLYETTGRVTELVFRTSPNTNKVCGCVVPRRRTFRSPRRCRGVGYL